MEEYPNSPGNIIILFPVFVTNRLDLVKAEYYPISSLRTQLDLIAAIEQWYSQPLLNNESYPDIFDIRGDFTHLQYIEKRIDILNFQEKYRFRWIITSSPGVYVVNLN